MIPDIALRALKYYYGYDDFRPAQKPVITHLLKGEDCLAIMPTGAGKSICFQIPALVRKGLTIVFTPLISLMKDQVDGLLTQQIPATYINSTLAPDEVSKRLQLVRQNKIKLLYIAPEKLGTVTFVNFLKSLPIAQIIIDEAHCVSQWGHDFRPAYCHIAPFIKSLNFKPVVGAFTATATQEVEEDIKKLLGLDEKKARVFRLGFDRPNLSFNVIHAKDRLGYVVDYVQNHSHDSGIIYCSTRKDVENVYQHLVKAGIKAGFYHGGLDDQTRRQQQEYYANDDIAVMVATNAFGMGIDKSNVRYVIHYQMPRNMEGYYQEAGRAGRDGAPSECILLYKNRDIMIHKYLIEQSVEDPLRRRIEFERLQAMNDYCYSHICLRKYILNYFGEEVHWHKCHKCSICNNKVNTCDMTEEARHIFQSIYDTEERYGSSMITDIVQGNRTERLVKYGYHRLKSFGTLPNMGVRDIKNFINALVGMGYLSVTPGKYPLLNLRAGAEAVLAGITRVEIAKENVLPDNYKSSTQKARERGVATASSSLFEKLRQLRKDIADRDGVKPYMVFPDTVLIDMAAKCPSTLAEMMHVKGIGEVKLKKYGAEFLKLIAKYKAEEV